MIPFSTLKKVFNPIALLFRGKTSGSSKNIPLSRFMPDSSSEFSCVTPLKRKLPRHEDRRDRPRERRVNGSASLLESLTDSPARDPLPVFRV